MAGLRKAVLAKNLTDAIDSSASSLLYGAFIGDRNDLPWECAIRFRDGATRRYLVYIWTITHGGRTRSRHEYRIQVKLKSARRLDFGQGTTLVLGYYSSEFDRVGREAGNHSPREMRIFAAWDPLQHLRLGASSSCQVSYEVLYSAYLSGSASSHRITADGESETVIAFRPEHLGTYFRAVSGGHNSLRLKLPNMA